MSPPMSPPMTQKNWPDASTLCPPPLCPLLCPPYVPTYDSAKLALCPHPMFPLCPLLCPLLCPPPMSPLCPPCPPMTQQNWPDASTLCPPLCPLLCPPYVPL